jgi:hypothetical protein
VFSGFRKGSQSLLHTVAPNHVNAVLITSQIMEQKKIIAGNPEGYH